MYLGQKQQQKTILLILTLLTVELFLNLRKTTYFPPCSTQQLLSTIVKGNCDCFIDQTN